MNIKSLGRMVSAFCVASIVCCIGCNQPVESGSNGAKKKALPKLSFHKPRNFGFAVERLREINDLLVAEAELPRPLSYTVIETSHAHGDGKSHVHYSLVKGSVEGGHESCDCDDPSHDHGDEHDHDGHGHKDPFAPEPEQHTVRVDIFTELTDIVRWLPAIASDSDMPADDWKMVKSTSEELGQTLETITGNGDEKANRESYREQVEKVNANLKKLEALVKPNAAKIL